MAESLLTQQPSGVKSLSRLQQSIDQTGRTESERILASAKTAGESTGQSYGADTAVARHQSASSGLTGIYADQAKAQRDELAASVVPRTQAMATQSNLALQDKAQSTVGQLERLNAFGEDVVAREEQAHQSWERVASQAKEYVANAEYAVARGIKEVTDIGKSIASNLDFSKAHDMQVAAQAVIGSMKQAEDAIRVNGKPEELQQFLQMKGHSLAVAQSELQGQYGTLKANIDTQMAQLRFDVQTKLQQYVGYNQQNHVGALSSMAASDAQMSIQTSQMIYAKEQAKTSISDSWASFLGSSPITAIDLQPMLMQVNLLYAEQQADAEYAKAQGGRSVTMDTSNWGKSLGQLGKAPDASQINAQARSNVPQKRA